MYVKFMYIYLTYLVFNQNTKKNYKYSIEKRKRITIFRKQHGKQV